MGRMRSSIADGSDTLLGWYSEDLLNVLADLLWRIGRHPNRIGN